MTRTVQQLFDLSGKVAIADRRAQVTANAATISAM